MALPPKPPPRPGQAFIDGLEAATADLDSLSLVDLGEDSPELDPIGGPSDSSPEPGARDLDAGAANLEIALNEEEPPPPSTAPARAPSAPPPPVAPKPASTRPEPGGHEASLALDFDAAGLAGPIKGQAAPGPESVQPRAAPPAVAAPPTEPEPPRTRAPGEKIGLFGEDRVLGFLIAGAIGLLVGLYPALQSARGMVEEETRDAMAELEDAVDRPLAVRAGDVRAPAEIVGDIERQYGPTRSRFWLVWLGIAIPVGLGLGLIKRKA